MIQTKTTALCLSLLVFLWSPSSSFVFLGPGCSHQSHFQKNLLCLYVAEEEWQLLRLSSAEDTLPSTLPLFLAKRDGWSELTLQAHLLQLWKRAVSPSLSSLISLSLFFFSEHYLFSSLLASLPDMPGSCSLCVMHQISPTHSPWHTCFTCFMWCSRKFSYATSNVHIK